MSEHIASRKEQAHHFRDRRLCPACGGRRTTLVFQEPYTESRVGSFLASYYRGRIDQGWLEGASYVLDRCMDCGTVFQRGAPSEQLLNELYGRWLNERYHPDRDPAVIEALARPKLSRDGHELFAVSHALGKPINELKVLDFGMGWGSWARVARKLGAQVYGYDLSEQRCEFARREGVEVVRLDQLDRLELDFINTEQVLEHLNDPSSAVERLGQGLARRGILKIAVPRAPLLGLRLLRPWWEAPRAHPLSLNAVHPLEHLNCFSPRGLDLMAGRFGLTRQTIGLSSYAAFAGHQGIQRRFAKQALKAVLRPAFHKFAVWQQYAWFSRSLTDG